MRPAHCASRWNDELNHSVFRERDHAALRHEVLRPLRAAQDLQKHGHGRRRKGRIVDVEAEVVVVLVNVMKEACENPSDCDKICGVQEANAH